MNRQERDRYDYGSYDDYRNDANYHSAQNLTDEFERHYRHEMGQQYDDRSQYDRVHSYHEGNMGDAYERRQQSENNYRGNSDYRQNDQNWNNDRDRLSNYRSNYNNYRGMDRNDTMDDNRNLRGNIREGYGVSDYEGTSDRYNTLNSNQYSSGRSNDRSYNSGSRDQDRGSRFSGAMGESGIHSDRGIPNYSNSSFEDDYGSVGSNYGSRSYSSDSDYADRQRGDSFRNRNYGSAPGNYGGYGSSDNLSSIERDDTSYSRNSGRSYRDDDRY
ncbi:hypothetical protein [Pontibacter populi]|uniref:SWFGD domain-containing protein n=1 Tax=Pontibacter populi TaxID=890055 RepID=A0ABV1RVT3_9BACT